MKESAFYQRIVKPFLEKQGYEINRVETGSTCPGFPDTYIRNKKSQFRAFIELKVGKASKTIVKPDWRPGQVAWGKFERMTGGFWYLFILVGDKPMLAREAKEEYTIDELIDLSDFAKEVK